MELRDLTDRYEIEAEIGRGSIGVIYRARDLTLGRHVALKILRPELRENDRHGTRFVREARLSARLGHPNIVPVYDVGRFDEGACLVMALLAGRSLRTIIRSGRIGTVRILSWFTQVCSGVAFAHREGVIHRDIKPAHVFVGDYNQVVLADWGLAKWIGRRAGVDHAGTTPPPLDDEPPRDNVTRQGDIIGTPAYMAPEQAEGLVEELDHRADIYALGAILYEILTGTRPYESSRSIDVLRAVRRGPPDAPRERAPHRDIPAELEAVCLRAMARAPTDRFDSALDLATNIEAHLESRVARDRKEQRRSREETRPEEGTVVRSRPGRSGSYDASAASAEAGASAEDTAEARRAAEEEEARLAAADQAAAERLAEGRAESAAFSRQLRHARGFASEAARLAASLPPDAPRGERSEVWRLSTRAHDIMDRAAYHLVAGVENLEAAAEGEAHADAARGELARLFRDAWIHAREVGDPVSAELHRARAEALDDGPLNNELSNRAALSVRTIPAEAIVDLATVDDRGPVWASGVRLRIGRTPISSRTLSATRVQVIVTAADGLSFRLPLRLEPGESRVAEVAVPPSSRVPPGFVFVPGGRFIMGSDDEAPGAAQPREVDIGSFCIGRQPVTWEAYLEYLEDLEATGRSPLPFLPRIDGQPLVEVGPDGRARWLVDPPERATPARFVSHDDAIAYADWLARRLRCPVRLPTEEEWEYAAGAADGRIYPWGGGWVPGFADARRRKARGPAPLAEHGDDVSPFGMRSVAGGVREWTATRADDPGRYLLRGGSWRGRPEQCRICARATGAAELTHESIGIRLVAEVPIP